MNAYDLDGIAGPNSSLTEDLMALGAGGGCGALALLLNNAIATQVDKMVGKDKENGYTRAGVHLVLGVAEGVLLGRYVHPVVGAGAGFAAVGFALARAVATAVPAARGADLNGLGDADDSDLLLGVGATNDQDDLLLGAELGDVSTETRRLNGLGNASEIRSRQRVVSSM